MSLEQRVLKVIESNKEDIIEVGEKIFTHPELGYKEFKTTKYIAQKLKDLGFCIEENIAITGVKARIPQKKAGPTVAILGELDALTNFDHPNCNKENGAVHACGHHIQSCVMYGVALALKKSGVLEELDGNITFFGVPAEEFIEIDYRSRLKKDGKINYFGGKQELAYRGYFDDIDISIMMHAYSMEDKKILIGARGNGFAGKNIRFIGEASHAGGAPEQGKNALNAAMLAINNINANRDTFVDDDHVRVHPIITKGGDVVNVVPSDVRMETYVRATTIQAIQDANIKVNRSLIAGAIAVGAEVEINEMPGYLPLINNSDIDSIIKKKSLKFMDESDIVEGEFFGGSTDFGDIMHIMPGAHPFISGVTGGLHAKEFGVIDPETAYILPIKILTLTIIELLSQNALKAKEVIKNFKPVFTREEYLKYLKDGSKTIVG